MIKSHTLLVLSTWTLWQIGTAAAFYLKSRDKLQAAVDECLKFSPEGDCSKRPNGPMGDWDVSPVTDMQYLFAGAASFKRGISRWDVSSVTNMRYMFHGATAFKGDLHKWKVSSVADMQYMFNEAKSFKGDIEMWDVSKVTKMGSMFSGASSFNGDISKWDVSSVKDMKSVFQEATAFSGDLSKWDMSSVNNMRYMFKGATSFNSDISTWDVSSVNDMRMMFYNARSFARALCGTAWVKSKAKKGDMFTGSSGSISAAACTTPSTTTAFSPSSKSELKTAIDTCDNGTGKRRKIVDGEESMATPRAHKTT